MNLPPNKRKSYRILFAKIQEWYTAKGNFLIILIKKPFPSEPISIGTVKSCHGATVKSAQSTPLA